VSRVSANGCSILACEVRVQNFILGSRTSSANVMSRASLGKLEHAKVEQPAA
jgi:hypothetical protein